MCIRDRYRPYTHGIRLLLHFLSLLWRIYTIIRCQRVLREGFRYFLCTMSWRFVSYTSSVHCVQPFVSAFAPCSRLCVVYRDVHAFLLPMHVLLRQVYHFIFYHNIIMLCTCMPRRPCGLHSLDLCMCFYQITRRKDAVFAYPLIHNTFLDLSYFKTLNWETSVRVWFLITVSELTLRGSAYMFTLRDVNIIKTS